MDGSIERQNILIKLFLRALLHRVPILRESRLVTIIEANLDSQMSAHIAFTVSQEIPSAVHMRHHNKKDANRVAYGVYTTSNTKFMCAHSVLQLLRMGLIQFHEHYVTVGRNLQGCLSDSRKTKIELLEQLRRYSRVSLEAKSHGQKDKVLFTGKMGEGMHDDAYMAMALIVHFSCDFYTQPIYMAYR